jgi:hypothetical protein
VGGSFSTWLSFTETPRLKLGANRFEDYLEDSFERPRRQLADELTTTVGADDER